MLLKLYKKYYKLHSEKDQPDYSISSLFISLNTDIINEILEINDDRIDKDFINYRSKLLVIDKNYNLRQKEKS